MASDADDLFAEIGSANLLAAMGESVIQYPQGNTGAPVTIEQVIVDLSSEGEQPVDDEFGSEVKRWGTLLIPVAVAISDAERGQQRDTFSVRGKIWLCEKVTGQTLALQTVRIYRVEMASTKRTRI